MPDEAWGRVEAEFQDDSGAPIDPRQHPWLYFEQGGTRVGGVGTELSLEAAVTNQDPSVFQQIGQALAPYVHIAQGLAGFVTSQGLGSLGDIFTGFEQALSSHAGLDGVTRFVTGEMTLTAPYPHPSGLRRVMLRSQGNAVNQWILPDLSPDLSDNTALPGVKQRVWPVQAWSNGLTHMYFDLHVIAQSPYWRVFFINDGSRDDRFFPITYWWVNRACAVVLFVKLKFVRYNWAPEVRTTAASAWSTIFVDGKAASVQDGYRPSDASTDLTEERDFDVILWKNGKVSWSYDEPPQEALEISALSQSRRLKYPGVGTNQNWGIDLDITLPPALQDQIPLKVIRNIPRSAEPNSEDSASVTQSVPGQALAPGNYAFDILIRDNAVKATRRKLLRVYNADLRIAAIEPTNIQRGGRVRVKGQFGFYIPPELGAPAEAMLKTVTVGGKPVPWERVGADLLLGPIDRGGRVTLSFWDSSVVESTDSIVIQGPPIKPDVSVGE
jgi:hypothetical protein